MLTVEASNLESVELSHYNHRQFWQFSELILFFFRPDNVTNMLDQFGMAPSLAAQVDYWTNSKKKHLSHQQNFTSLWFLQQKMVCFFHGGLLQERR